MATRKICMLLNGTIANDSRVIRIIQSLSKHYIVHLFYVNGRHEDLQMFDSEKVKLHSVNYQKDFKQKVVAATFFYKEYDFFVQEVLRTKLSFDYIYANDLPCCSPGLQLKKILGAKLIYDSHEIFIETINQFFISGNNPVKNFLFRSSINFMRSVGRQFEQKVFDNIDLLISVNESILNYLCNTYSYKNRPFANVMNCPLPLPENIEAIDIKSKFGWSNESSVIIYQGALNYGRGLEMFLNTLLLLPSSFKWLILGDGILKPTLQKKCRTLGLEDRVQFGGKVKESSLAAYTMGCDIGVNLLEPINLSKALASPNKLFQYIQAKIPTVCSDTSENKKVIEQYEIGKVTRNIPKEIAATILHLQDTFIVNDSVFQAAAKNYSFENQEKKLLESIASLN